MWWDIIKSSRNEAYSAFLEEFGPSVELDSLILDQPEPGLIQLVGDKWHINLEAGEISFHSMTLGHETFVEGMFKQEYPERYKDIIEMFDAAKSAELRLINPLGNKDVIYDSTHLPDFLSMSSSDRAKWLREHDFCYAASGKFVGPKVRNYLIGSLISYYEEMGASEVTAYLNSVSYNFGEFTNIGELFYQYGTHMHDWFYNRITFTRNKINSTNGQFEIIRDILEGRLQKNPYYKRHFGGQGGTILAIRHKGDE